MIRLGPALAAFAAVLFMAPGHKAIAKREPEPVNAAGKPLKRGNHRESDRKRDSNKRHRRV